MSETLTVSKATEVIVTLSKDILAKFHNRSLSYVLEELVSQGAKTLERSQNSAEETRNAKDFAAVLANNPSLVQDAAAMQKLMQKCSIGGTREVHFS